MISINKKSPPTTTITITRLLDDRKNYDSFEKKPFSYSIHEDIDKYKKHISHSNSKGVIVELPGYYYYYYYEYYCVCCCSLVLFYYFFSNLVAVVIYLLF